MEENKRNGHYPQFTRRAMSHYDTHTFSSTYLILVLSCKQWWKQWIGLGEVKHRTGPAGARGIWLETTGGSVIQVSRRLEGHGRELIIQMDQSRSTNHSGRKMKWLVLLGMIPHCKAILGRGQPGLRWICYESRPWWIDCLTCWPAVQCATTDLLMTPNWLYKWTNPDQVTTKPGIEVNNPGILCLYPPS